jgi:A/G-specific adenine glycosylase
MEKFTEILMKWHKQHNTREMPWKGEKDPYKIWLSEVILQQTRVAQGWQYYNNL